MKIKKTNKVFTDENFIKVLLNMENVKDKEWNWIQLKFNKIEKWKWELISDNVNKVKQILLFDYSINNLDWISNFTNLEVLDLSSNKTNYKIIINNENLTKLQEL